MGEKRREKMWGKICRRKTGGVAFELDVQKGAVGECDFDPRRCLDPF